MELTLTQSNEQYGQNEKHHYNHIMGLSINEPRIIHLLIKNTMDVKVFVCVFNLYNENKTIIIID